jgi:hypothetical protein
MSKRLDLRFAVGSEETGPLSSVWRVWSNNRSHVMATIRGMHGICKLTMHAKNKPDESPWCTFGPEKRYYEEQMPALGISQGDQRPLFPPWQRPEGRVDAAVPVFIVVVPHAFLRRGCRVEKPVTWIDPPGEGMALHILFLYTRASEVALKGVNQLLAVHILPNGESVFVAVHEKPFDADAFRRGHEPRLNRSTPRFLTFNQDLREAQHLRALFIAPPEIPEGPATFVDVAA